MTLCIARRLRNGVIELASDSRIVLNRVTGRYFDSGIKVFALPATIRFPIPDGEEDNEENYVGTTTFGLAVSGSTLHSYLVKESVGETLRNLAIVPGYTSLNLDNICNLIYEPFDRLAADIDQATDERWYTHFLFTGRCLETRRYRAFLFELGRSQFGMGTSFREVLIENDIEFIGSGSAAAQAIYASYPAWRTVWIVDQVIRDGSDISVGGHVQYGNFGETFDFSLRAIPRYTITEEGEWERGIFLRGVPVYKPLDSPDAFLHLPAISDYFRPDLIEKWNRAHPGQEFHP